jgi:hypothetical protein
VTHDVPLATLNLKQASALFGLARSMLARERDAHWQPEQAR